VVSFKLALNNPTLPEITDGYETKLHHAPGHDQDFGECAIKLPIDPEV
jgi:hypothetical protein